MISEIAYTETLTFWSTLISAPLVYLGSWSIKGTEAMFGEAGASLVKALLQFATAPIKEVFEEIIKDAFIEAFAESLVDFAGGSEDLGFWISSLSTSARETGGALGQLALGDVNLKTTIQLLKAKSSGDVQMLAQIDAQIKQSMKQKREAAIQKRAEMSTWQKLFSSDIFKGLAMITSSLFFGASSFFTLLGFNNMLQGTVGIAPKVFGEAKTIAHAKRKAELSQDFGTMDLFTGKIIDTQMKKPSNIDGEALNDLFYGQQQSDTITEVDSPPLTINFPTVNPNPKLIQRSLLVEKFGEINSFQFRAIHFNPKETSINRKTNIETNVKASEKFKGFFNKNLKTLLGTYSYNELQRLDNTLELLSKVDYKDYSIYDVSVGPYGAINFEVLESIFKKADNQEVLSELESQIMSVGAFLMGSPAIITRSEALHAFDSFVNELINLLSKVYRTLFNEMSLASFLGVNERYFHNVRDNIKNHLDRRENIEQGLLFKFLECIRIDLLEFSGFNNMDLSADLDELTRIFNDYIRGANYFSISANSIYFPLTKLSSSLIIILNKIGVISSTSITGLESFCGFNFRYYQFSVKNSIYKDIQTRNYVILYNTLRFKYKSDLARNDLLQEFDNAFFELFNVFKKEILLRPEDRNTVRGGLIEDIINFLPDNFFIDRNVLSKILFNDEYYLMKTYLHPDNKFSNPHVNTYKAMINNILKLESNSINLYAGDKLSSAEIRYFKESASRILKFYKEHHSYQQTTLPEMVLRYYMEYIFGDTFEKDSNVDWLVGVGGDLLELDGYNKNLRIAFEFNGPQHFKLEHWLEVYKKSPDVAMKRYVSQNLNDLTKIRECKENGVVLILLSYLDHPSNWYVSIIKQYEIWTGNKVPQKQILDYENVLRLVSSENLKEIRVKFLKTFK